MKPLILLNFDGVLFNSAYEAYQVCEFLVEDNDDYRDDLSFDDFMIFRSYLIDAWQFARLYQKDRVLIDVSKLPELEPDMDDWLFSGKFFNARKNLMLKPEWAKLMSP